jgi:RNA polymerase sigma-70 factor, ECF subfamily
LPCDFGEQDLGPRQMCLKRMGYLRLVHSTSQMPPPESGYLEAFDRELSYVFETLRRLGARPAEIEDLAQDVFVVLQRNWVDLDTSRPIRPYLFGIAFRIVSAHRRRRVRETPWSAVDAEDLAANPEETLQGKEAVSLLLAALNHVPLPRRAVIVMHELDGVPVADIARTLSISRFGTYARLRKGRKELAAAVRRLSKEGVRR